MNWTQLNDWEYVSGEWRIKLREERYGLNDGTGLEPDYYWLWAVYEPGDDYDGAGYDSFSTLEEAMECAAELCNTAHEAV